MNILPILNEPATRPGSETGIIDTFRTNTSSEEHTVQTFVVATGKRLQEPLVDLDRKTIIITLDGYALLCIPSALEPDGFRTHAIHPQSTLYREIKTSARISRLKTHLRITWRSR